MPEWVVNLLSFGGPTVGVLIFVFLYIAIFHTEKLQRFASLVWDLIDFFIGVGKKKSLAFGIQGKVNEFSKSLAKKIIGFEPVGIKIRWINSDENPEQFMEDGKLIIKMKKDDSKNRNFVNVSMVFISQRFLHRVKKYLSYAQKESLDLFAARKLFENERQEVLGQFIDDFFDPKQIENRDIMELLSKYDLIDQYRLFFPVLVQELTFLGHKVFYDAARVSRRLKQEVRDLIEHLYLYANREIGDESTPSCFLGAYCRCAIVIIAKWEKRVEREVRPYVSYVDSLIKEGVESIYLLGGASMENSSFIREVSRRIESKYDLQVHPPKRYRAKIRNREGKSIEVESYLILHRSKEIATYYGKEAVEKSEGLRIDKR